jgi:hypothetical protein
MKPPPLALGRRTIRVAMVEHFRQLPTRESETLNPIA